MLCGATPLSYSDQPADEDALAREAHSLFRIRFDLYAVLSRIGPCSTGAALADELAGDLGR